MGFGILAIVIGYLPVLYQAFSRREVNISLLDARAGSPPCAVELLRRYGQHQSAESLGQFLYEWERWAAELLESHLSYPTLAYFRSQHDNQSWLAALTMIMDACTLIMVGIDGTPEKKARLTFAMARHAAVDLAQNFRATPHPCHDDRLLSGELEKVRAILAQADVPLKGGREADEEPDQQGRVPGPAMPGADADVVNQEKGQEHGHQQRMGKPAEQGRGDHPK